MKWLEIFLMCSLLWWSLLTPKWQKLSQRMGYIYKQTNKQTMQSPTPQAPKLEVSELCSFAEELWELFFLVKKKLSLECKFWFWLSVTACFEVFQTKINISITERIIVVLFRIIWVRVASNLRIYKVLLRPQRLWKSLTLFCFVNFP